MRGKNTGERKRPRGTEPCGSSNNRLPHPLGSAPSRAEHPRLLVSCLILLSSHVCTANSPPFVAQAFHLHHSPTHSPFVIHLPSVPVEPPSRTTHSSIPDQTNPDSSQTKNPKPATDPPPPIHSFRSIHQAMLLGVPRELVAPSLDEPSDAWVLTHARRICWAAERAIVEREARDEATPPLTPPVDPVAPAVLAP